MMNLSSYFSERKLQVRVSEVSKLLGKSEQFIRIGLQQGRLPFGTAVKTSSKWNYHISEKLLQDYLGEEHE